MKYNYMNNYRRKFKTKVVLLQLQHLFQIIYFFYNCHSRERIGISYTFSLLNMDFIIAFVNKDMLTNQKLIYQFFNLHGGFGANGCCGGSLKALEAENKFTSY